AGTAGGAGIYINNNVGITGNATTGTAVSLTGTTKAAGVTGIQTGSSSVIKGYSDISLKATAAGSGITLSGTIIGINSGTGVANVAVESNGGTIAAGGLIRANNISLDNTNGSIDATTGVITRGGPVVTTGRGVSASALDANNNINIAGFVGNSGGNEGVLLYNSTQGIRAGNAINVYGSTGGSHGVSVLNSQMTAGGPIAIAGNQTANKDLGVIIWQGSTITANGGSYAAGADAIKIAGSGTRGVVINNASIINNSTGGNTSISGTGGGSANTQLDNGAVITNASSAGAVLVSASGYDASGVGATVGASNTTTYGALPTITQNSNAGVIISSQYGNVAPPKIINNGNGDVVIAAGTGFTAGNGLSANITAPAGSTSSALNPVINSGTGKVYLYSGSTTATGNLSVLNAGFNNLYFAGSGVAPNAQLNTAYSVGRSVSGSTSNMQIMFREVATTPAPLPLPPNVNPVSPVDVPSSTQSAGLGVSFGPASIEDSDICSTKRSCNCDATDTAGVEICYSIDVDTVKSKIQISKLVGGKW
ncbi:hypothetical protein M2128_001454, partial [Polynucleobacter sphagniphilus]|uniref:beta strand repeat-containing protein n=1 Tax=Polynucleobacter sphagniphilus TaxID=1743169 RepID=UPI002475F7B1